MGTFDTPDPINYLGSTSVGKSITMVVDRNDPWVLPSHHEPQVPLSAVDVSYRDIVDTIANSITTPSTVSKESEEAYLPVWADNSLYSYDCLDMFFPSDGAILEAMIGQKNTCEYLHHKSFFLPEFSRIENQEFHVRLEEGVDSLINPLPKEGVFFEKNMENISATIPINISINPNVIENVHIGANCSSEEIAIYTALFKDFGYVFS